MQPSHSDNRQNPRVSIAPGFVWDAQQAYLFDIDGTLLRSRDRIHVDSFAPSIQRVTGFEVTLAGIVLHGATDTGILREACEQAGIPAEIVAEHTDAILQAMCERVQQQQDNFELVRMPGVNDALRHLAARGALLGVATGNLELIGWLKIEHAGLREWFRFGGFSDRYPVRSELVAQAAAKARELAGAQASVCVVGDTPRDIEAARANSLPVIAVATGRYTFEELLQHEPDVCTTTLADLLEHTREAAA